MNSRINRLQWKIRNSIHRLQAQYRKNPWIFITESDIQCSLYSEMMKFSSGVRRAVARDYRDKKVRDWDYRLLTRPIHAELSSRRRKATEFVDLCLIDPTKFIFWIKRRQFDRFDKRFPIWDWDWKTRHAIGIEIKFNRWVTKRDAYSRLSKRTRVTDKWKRYIRRLVRDIKKLKSYKRGWLILVDHHSLMTTRNEWRNFVDEIIRKSNYGKAKRTLNAYYLCPKLRKALSYKPPSYHNW